MIPDKPSDAFKDRLRIAREGLRAMSQVDLAKATGLPASSIAHFEGGGRKPSFDNLRKLANALNVTTDYLLGRVDEPEVAQSADPLYRYGANLTEENRALAEDFLRMLAERDGKDRERQRMNWTSEFRQRALMRQAQQLLDDEGLLSLPVDLSALGDSRDIVIEEMTTSSGGVSGMLVRHGNSFGILYDSSIPNEGFQRFSIAHELGHYFVGGHLDQIAFVGGAHKSRAGFLSDDPIEREADYFAAGLLMPQTPVNQVIRQHPDGLRAIEAIQRDAHTSLTASAIRYTGLTDAAAAVIVSRNGKIDYCFMSDAMKSLKFDTWPRKGSPIPEGTATAAVVKLPKEQRQAAREEDESNIVEWLGGRLSAPAQEEVLGLGSYDRVLTVLTCPNLLDEGFMDEDDDADEALEKSWTPRLRR